MTEQRKFGTFGGVFTPCTLTILGVIMFLRFGQVVGNAGVVHALAIVAVSKAITLLTAFSLSAVATNTQVRGGGAYYLISRSLGVEFGGAIGIVFFLAQAVSVAMYVIGFTEAFVAAFPNLGLGLVPLATIVNVVVFVCCYIGAGWTIKLQYGILALLGASLVAFYGGVLGTFSWSTFGENLGSSYAPGESFGSMFALFFPAVTGIMAGANMSGDLRTPGRSIPSGTLTAILVTGVVYVSMALCFAGVAPSSTLIANPLVINDVSLSRELVTLGIFAATLSSALGSMMGAPRILQAFARDRVFERLRPFAKGAGPSGEPRRATVLTFVIAQLGILLGDLNMIAPVITMFFMVTYGALNLATFYEAITKNPSYRPRFRYAHWSLSLVGFLGCVGAMTVISPLFALVSIVLMGAIMGFISRHEVEARWGSVQSGTAFERARKNLLSLERELAHPKNWRPVILALTGSAWSRVHVALFGQWLTGGRGILSLGQIIVGDFDKLIERRRNQLQLLRESIREQALEAFPVVVIGADRAEALRALIQCHGLGGFHPNTVLLGWPNDPDRVPEFEETLALVARLGRSLVVVRTEGIEHPEAFEAPEGPIDVWWRGQENGSLMLLLAHLLTLNDAWRQKKIRLWRMISKDLGVSEAREHLTGLIQKSRIQAEPHIAVGQDAGRVIQAVSSHASLVLLGLPIRTEELLGGGADAEHPEKGGAAGLHERMASIVEGLPRVLFVRSAGGVDLEA